MGSGDFQVFFQFLQRGITIGGFCHSEWRHTEYDAAAHALTALSQD